MHKQRKLAVLGAVFAFAFAMAASSCADSDDLPTPPTLEEGVEEELEREAG